MPNRLGLELVLFIDLDKIRIISNFSNIWCICGMLTHWGLKCTFASMGRSSSVHAMAFRMFDARSLFEPMSLLYIGPFETTNNVLIKMCPVLSRPQCDNYEVFPHKEVGGFMSPEITEIRVLHEMYSAKIDSILCQVFNWCVVGNVGSAVRFFAILRKYPIHIIH